MERNKGQTRIALAIVMISSFITPFMSNAINLAIPAIGTQFGGSQSWLNWVVSSFLITCAAFLLPFGHLADRYGRKRIFLLGMILLAIASLACALANSLPALVLFRAIQGIASAMVFSNSMAILTSVVPPQSRGKMLGLNAAATYIGLSAGPVLGGLIASTFTWRGIFYFNLLIALIVIVLTLWKLQGEWKGTAFKFDTWGSVFCIASQALILFGLGDLTTGYIYQLSFIAGILILIVFVRYEMRRQNPLIPIGDFIKNRQFTFSNLASLINYSATFALGFVLSLYLQTTLGIDTATSGLILLVQPVIMTVLSPFSGALSDRVQPAVLSALGMSILAVGLFLFVFLSPQTPIILIILNLAFIGLGFGLFASPNTNAIMSSVDRSLYGVAASVMGNMRLLGQSTSMAIVSLITSALIGDLTIGSAGYADKLMISSRISFIVFTILCIFGVFASLARGKIVREGEER